MFLFVFVEKGIIHPKMAGFLFDVLTMHDSHGHVHHKSDDGRLICVVIFFKKNIKNINKQTKPKPKNKNNNNNNTHPFFFSRCQCWHCTTHRRSSRLFARAVQHSQFACRLRVTQECKTSLTSVRNLISLLIKFDLNLV